MEKVAFILGSNLENRLSIIQQALDKIALKIGEIILQSKPYETPPWGYESSNPFINQAVVIKTLLNPQKVMNICLEIETELGRKRTSPNYEDRTIDIDIALWENKQITSQTLMIPHPLIKQRQFVLIPLNEIIPNWTIELPKEALETVSSALNKCIQIEGKIEIKQL